MTMPRRTFILPPKCKSKAAGLSIEGGDDTVNKENE